MIQKIKKMKPTVSNTKDKKAIVKKLIEDKKKLQDAIKTGKSINELAKETGIKFVKPI